MDFKIGDIVFLAEPPHWLTSPEDGNIIEGRISEIKTTQKFKGKETEYLIDIGFQNRTVKPENIYLDKKSALQRANELVEERIKHHKERLTELEACKAANAL